MRIKRFSPVSTTQLYGQTFRKPFQAVISAQFSIASVRAVMQILHFIMPRQSEIKDFLVQNILVARK